MTSLRLTSAMHSRRDHRSFGRLVRPAAVAATTGYRPSAAPVVGGLIEDLKLFAGTFAAGFVFLTVYLA